MLKELAALKKQGFLQGTPRVLDTGCGAANLLFALSDAGFECAGIDLSPERIERAQKQYPQMTFTVGSMTQVDFPDASFDLVVSTQTVEHLLDEDLEVAFQEMARLVKPGGLVFVTTRFCEDLTQGFHVCPDCHAVYRYSQHLQSFDISRLTALFETVGLTLVMVKRSRCRNHLRDLLPYRRLPFLRPLDPLLHRLFGARLDREMGKYLVAIATKPSALT